MADALQRIVYEATVDDAVDVGLRLAKRTKAFRRQVQFSIILVGVLMAVAAIALSVYTAPPVNSVDLLLVVLLAAVFGILMAALFRRFFDKEIRKQHRRIVLEQFGGKASFQSELELRPDAVWVRQAGMEMVFPWALCTSVEDNTDDIELNFTPGICVVRNRHFVSSADRQAFLDTARSLSSKRSQ